MKLFSLFFAAIFAALTSFCTVAQNAPKDVGLSNGPAVTPITQVAEPTKPAATPTPTPPTSQAVAPGVSCEPKVCVEPGKTAAGVSPKPVVHKKVIARKTAPKPDMDGVALSVGPQGIDRVERNLPGKDIQVFVHSGPAKTPTEVVAKPASVEPAIRTTVVNFYDLRTIATVAPATPVAVAPTVQQPKATSSETCRLLSDGTARVDGRVLPHGEVIRSVRRGSLLPGQDCDSWRAEVSQQLRSQR